MGQSSYRPNSAPTGGTANTYANRYQRGGHKLMTALFDSGPYILAIGSFVLSVVCLGALEGIDVITGKFTAEHMSNAQMGWFFSTATTGLTLALIGTFFYGWRNRWSWKILVPLAVLAAIPAGIDVFFDAMSVDIIRFGFFINVSQQFAGNPTEALMHNLFRVMVGALSAIGEPLAAGSVMIFPVMKEIFKGVFD